MRVAMISPLFESVPPRLYGGTERVVYNLCRGLTDLNIEVTLFASGDSCIEGRVVPVIDEALRLRRNPVSDPLVYNLRMLSLVAERANEFDVIHNHHEYWMFPLTLSTDTPVVTTLHGRLDIPDLQLALQSFPKNQFVAISDAQKNPIPDLRWLRTIYHGIDVSEFKFQSKPGNYLSFLGRICPEKRPDLAIEIAKRSGIPLKMAAKIEGQVGKDYYDTYIRPHVDGRFIEYIGEISESEKSDFLGNSLALLFPIDWPEPFGLVLLESLACGTPVLARPCGSVPEILADGITGYVSSDIWKLTEGAIKINKISRKKCREWVEQRFSLKRMTEDYLHVYRYLAEFQQRAFGHRWNFLPAFQRTAERNS